MVETGDTTALKAVAARREGSSPSPGTALRADRPKWTSALSLSAAPGTTDVHFGRHDHLEGSADRARFFCRPVEPPGSPKGQSLRKGSQRSGSCTSERVACAFASRLNGGRRGPSSGRTRGRRPRRGRARRSPCRRRPAPDPGGRPTGTLRRHVRTRCSVASTGGHAAMARSLLEAPVRGWRCRASVNGRPWQGPSKWWFRAGFVPVPRMRTVFPGTVYFSERVWRRRLPSTSPAAIHFRRPTKVSATTSGAPTWP